MKKKILKGTAAAAGILGIVITGGFILTAMAMRHAVQFMDGMRHDR